MGIRLEFRENAILAGCEGGPKVDTWKIWGETVRKIATKDLKEDARYLRNLHGTHRVRWIDTKTGKETF